MPRKKPADPTLQLDNQICFALYSATNAFNRVYKPLLASLGLTYPQYLVMMVLWEQDHITVSRIGERLFLDSGTLTPLLKRLESAGLVRRVRDAQDERRVMIELTSAGANLRDKAKKVPEGILQAAACSVDDLISLKEAVVALRDRLRDAAKEGDGDKQRKS